MRQNRAVEFGTGLFVLLGIGALFFLTTQTTGRNDFSNTNTYVLEARFDNVGSLKSRSPVAMSGVTIGRVTNIEFDGVSLEAVVTLVIDSQYDQIPDDSAASILTAGLLGSQYIGMRAGNSTATRCAPSKPTIVNTAVRNGMEITPPRNLGTRTRCIGLTAIISIADS